MKINSLTQYPTFILIICISMSSCCEKYDNNTDQNNFNHNQVIMKDKDSPDSKKIQKQIKELKNTNIVYFDLNKYNILPQFIQILNEHADFLYKHSEQKIIIEGHTDEQGTPEYNIALGERRANSVKTYLQIQGVLENQITIVSYGKEKPALLGHSEKEYSKNRRALLVYLM